jgi:hypothetical protein
MYTSVPLAFHIVCDAPAEAVLRHRFGLLHSPTHAVNVTFYRLSADAMQARLAREGAVVSDHSAGSRACPHRVCPADRLTHPPAAGMMKLFLHEILPPSVPRAIFVDTDALFLHDPRALWRTFADPAAFPPGTALALPMHLEQDAPAWHDASRICSCVLLLDLARLRARTLMDSAFYRAAARPALAPAPFAAMFGAPAPGAGYRGVKLGDQGYWWALVNGTAGLAAPLDYAWEVSSCLLDMYGTDAAPGGDAADDAAVRAQMLHLGESPFAGAVVRPRLLHLCVARARARAALTPAATASTARRCTGSGPAGPTPRATRRRSAAAGARPCATTSASSGRG